MFICRFCLQLIGPQTHPRTNIVALVDLKEAFHADLSEVRLVEPMILAMYRRIRQHILARAVHYPLPDEKILT